MIDALIVDSLFMFENYEPHAGAFFKKYEPHAGMTVFYYCGI